MQTELPILVPSLGGLLSLIVTFALPLVVGLLSKRSWSSTVKGVLLLAVAFVKTLIEAWLTAINAGLDFNFWVVLYSTGITFLFAVGSYLGLLKGSAIAEAAKDALVKDNPPGYTPTLR